MLSSRASDKYIPTLDGWRAIAIALVMCAHGSDELRDWLAPLGLRLEIPHELGLLGVQVFFAMSGFLITTKMLDAERSSRGFSRRDFYLRRVFRILPASMTFLAVVGVLALCGVLDVTPGRWLSTVLFWANYSTAAGTWYVGHFWSLAVEEHFYMLWPLVFVLVRSPRPRLAVVVAAIALVALWRAVSFKFGIGTASMAVFWGRTDIVADGILCGVAVALALRHEPWASRLKRVLAHPAATPVLVAAVVLIETIALPDWKATLALLSLKLVLLPLAILSTVMRPDGLLARPLEWRALRWIGRISYSLYLYQQLFLVWDVAQAPGLRAFQTLPASLLFALACAYASYRWIETPMIQLGHRWMRSRTAALA